MIDPRMVFTVAVLVVAGVIIKYGFNTNGQELKKKGVGIWTGIILFIAILVTPVWVFGAEKEDVTWINEAYVFMGVDYAKKTSPVCIMGGGDKVGSHGGFGLNIMSAGPAKMDFMYLHESCAVAEDDKTKDAFLLDFRFNFTDDLVPFF